ncbi:acyltransferase family protein [Pseudomonas aeruginosa]|uniref:acyltransferase family protein n=1 Tax=Pseudomonas aeruginosa TaxID=287 RepID=UPI001069C5E5|nr:acyltransferase family protein [Pseudomonas aeruginosa]EMC3961616.1 acyltransferase [Pseudomonas aeruginosa]MDI3653279.1 acyltransferase [Pseudomonas aeruginosa]NPS37578.1 acyltransferase [Pseudomonas aeruginosa]NPS87297.1 acyltransferase [Pseudomonas aeruginosa]
MKTEQIKSPIGVAGESAKIGRGGKKIHTHSFEFFVGALVAFLFMSCRLKLNIGLALPLMLGGLSMGSISLVSSNAPLATNSLYPMGAAILIAAIESSGKLKTFFSFAPFVKLGELSFGLYLTHFITVNSIASWTSLHTDSTAVIFAAYAVSTTITTILFTYAIDKPWISILNKLFRSATILFRQQATS